MKSSSTFNSRNLPLSLLAGLSLIFAFQWLLAESESFWHFCYANSKPISDDALRLEAQLRKAPRSGHDDRVFLIGSSQVREDFDADYLNNAFHEKMVFYNLGTSGNGSPIDMFMLKRQLVSGKPDVLIYVPFVGSFYSEYDVRKLKYYFDPVVLPYLAEYLGAGAILLNEQLKTAVIDSFLGMASVLYQYRESLRRIILREIKNFLYQQKPAEFERYAYSKGKPRTYYEKQITKAQGRKYTVTPFTALSKELFVLFAREVISQRVKLVVMSGPVHPLMKKCYEKVIDEDYNSFLSGQAAKLGFIYLSARDLPTFGEAEFIDFTHLNARGRSTLTRFLEEYLRNAGTI